MQNTHSPDNFDQIIDQTAARLRDLISKRDLLADQQRQIAAVTADIQKRQEQLDLFQAPTQQVPVTTSPTAKPVKQYVNGRPVKVRKSVNKGGRVFSEHGKQILRLLADKGMATSSSTSPRACHSLRCHDDAHPASRARRSG